MAVNGQAAGFDLVRHLDDATTAIVELSAMLRREADLGRVLQRSVGQLVQVIPGADMVSVTLLHGRRGRPETAASTSEQALLIDADQYAADEGPCLEAARTGRLVRAATAQARERWPEFARRASEVGVESYPSAPQDTNVKVREIAERVVGAVAAGRIRDAGLG